jgi:hypothetical protein
MLNPIPVIVYLKKSGMPILSAISFKAACVHLQNEQVSNTHHTQPHPPTPTPQEHNPAQPLGRLNLPLEKSEKQNQ